MYINGWLAGCLVVYNVTVSEARIMFGYKDYEQKYLHINVIDIPLICIDKECGAGAASADFMPEQLYKNILKSLFSFHVRTVLILSDSMKEVLIYFLVLFLHIEIFAQKLGTFPCLTRILYTFPRYCMHL